MRGRLAERVEPSDGVRVVVVGWGLLFVVASGDWFCGVVVCVSVGGIAGLELRGLWYARGRGEKSFGFSVAVIMIAWVLVGAG